METRQGSTARWRADYEAFRLRLVAARESAGLTQREAAERLRRDRSFVAKCETGERRVDVVELQQFARVYRKPWSYFKPKG